ncbi:MAG: M28 family peptidase [Paludibacter sp.]|nr:M28 family peptidase [Paludibacter sp.]
MRKIIFCTLIICTAFFVFSCKKTKPQTDNHTQKTVVVPQFSADSAYKFVENQVNFGARVPNTQNHERCAAYLVATLKRFGAQVVEQKVKLQAFDGKTLDATNIIGSFLVENPRRILLCAHWDTRPFADQDANEKNFNTPILGANDGASGVGVLLEIARNLAKDTADIGIDIVFFDAEDYGAPETAKIPNSSQTWCLGSQYWTKNPHKMGYTAQFGILLDMVGAPNATFYREQYSDYFAYNIVDKVWNKAASLGFSQYFINDKTGAITDDHLFVNQNINIPTIDIIHYSPNNKHGFGDYWHTLNDNMQSIDKQTLNAVGTTVMNVIYNEK